MKTKSLLNNEQLKYFEQIKEVKQINLNMLIEDKDKLLKNIDKVNDLNILINTLDELLKIDYTNTYCIELICDMLSKGYRFYDMWYLKLALINITHNLLEKE
jgi:hypothetical protein